MKNINLLLLILLTGGSVQSQNLIGFDSESIKKHMKENCKNMNFEKAANPQFSYLKYSDNSDYQTLFFFLGPDSVCKSERLIINQIVKLEKVKEFNSVYRKNGENSWIDNRNGKKFLIEIKDEKWYSVVTMSPFK